MKAALFQRAGQPLSVENVPDPRPLAHEVVVRVVRCGICTSDLHMTESDSDWVSAGDILGHEFAGEVVESGAQVVGLKPGDRVAILPTAGCGDCIHCRAGEWKWCHQAKFRQGGYAQLAPVSADNCMLLPTTVSFADGALVEPLAVALHGVVSAGISVGSKVLVIGAGPIGLGAMFWSRRLGAARVVAVAASRRHVALAERMGIDEFLVADETLADSVARTFAGQPDIVLECSGAIGLIERAVSLVATRGTVGVLGFCMQNDSFSPVTALSKELSLKFALMYGRRDFEQAIDALDAGAVEPRAMITDTIGFDAFPDMFEALRGRTPHSKVHIDPWA
jgi:(R,R)-butanediol dehydrogenase/meso-butanediol dehydrogenase/diacetyl reductase